MKHLVTVTIEAPSHHELRQAVDVVNNSVNAGRHRLNGGVRVRIGNTDGNDPSDMKKTLGQLQWWSTKEASRQTKEKPKKGFFGRMADELNSIFEDDEEDKALFG